MHRIRILIVLLLIPVLALTACQEDRDGENTIGENEEPSEVIEVEDEIDTGGDGPLSSDDLAALDDAVAGEQLEEIGADEVEDLSDPLYSVAMSGGVDLLFDNTMDDTDYNYDYEEPASFDTDALPTTGFYVMNFSQGATDLFIRFSDTLTTGRYEVGAADPDDAATSGQQMLDVVSARAEVGDVSYNTAIEGALTFDRFSDDLASGEFEFLLESSENDTPLTVSGEFENIEIITQEEDTLDEVTDEVDYIGDDESAEDNLPFEGDD
jgi:hypothetical protein